MMQRTISEKILSSKSGSDARAGDVVVCDVDLVLGTDASAPMAIAYFEKMGGTHVHDASRVIFALDHYTPASESDKTAGFHRQVREFARAQGVRVYEVGEGISHTLAVERGHVRPGQLVIGADSHTVTCGALNAFAVGVGSSDLAAAMLTGQLWLRVPETIRVVFDGARPAGVAAKDIALAMVAALGTDGANYRALEIGGPSAHELTLDDRLVVSNLAVEAGAKAALWEVDHVLRAALGSRGIDTIEAVSADGGARYARELLIDLASLTPRVALPHSPGNVVPIDAPPDTPIDMVYLGTCTGGRVSDYHEALAILECGGGRIADGVQLVVTPASREVERQLSADGTLDKLARMGAVITTPGCGACCGTSGVIPSDGMNVMSTANRNFKARMGNATASIYLASPAACAAAALTGRITDPRSVRAAP
ncbi:MAG TPA: aconitase/3-isopropylmalate dehydratase large subunit family protein [Gemmatimonadaceae bacterium]|nr:aconitase/3-isopropylmalate dehydratase large subunit family protein [Gemmatimonadaceae bacterium]